MSESIHEAAIVKKTEGSYAWIASASSDGCSSCSSKNSCSNTNFIKPLLDSKLKNEGIRVANTLNAKVGDRVVVAMESSQLLMGTFLAYMLPLVLLFIFAILGKVISGELVSTVLGMVGLFVGLLLAKKVISAGQLKNKITPVMLKFENNYQYSSSQVIQPHVG